MSVNLTLKIMIRGIFVNSQIQCCRKQFASRNVKVYKYIPTPAKIFCSNKDSKLPPPTKIDQDTAELLERISLVGIENEKAIQILEEAIAFADQIFDLDTEKVKPLDCILENQSLYLREDVPALDVTPNELISQSKITQENYFVTPEGNLEYIPEKKLFNLPVLKKACKD